MTDRNKRNALLDARTLYDLACIAADDPKAGHEKVQARKIALRNYKFIEALAAPAEGGGWMATTLLHGRHGVVEVAIVGPGR